MFRQFADHQILDVIPESAGPRVTTFRGGAVYSVRPPGSQTFLTTGHCIGIMQAPAPGLKASLGSDKVHEYDATPGMMVINPANVDSRLAWPTTRENIVIALTPESLLELAAHEFDAGNVELQPPPFGTFDPWALTIAEHLKAELTRDEGASELYIDSLITLFGVRPVRKALSLLAPSRY
jgi:AraC family transcriptional regulator